MGIDKKDVDSWIGECGGASESSPEGDLKAAVRNRGRSVRGTEVEVAEEYCGEGIIAICCGDEVAVVVGVVREDVESPCVVIGTCCGPTACLNGIFKVAVIGDGGGVLDSKKMDGLECPRGGVARGADAAYIDIIMSGWMEASDEDGVVGRNKATVMAQRNGGGCLARSEPRGAKGDLERCGGSLGAPCY